MFKFPVMTEAKKASPSTANGADSQPLCQQLYRSRLSKITFDADPPSPKKTQLCVETLHVTQFFFKKQLNLPSEMSTIHEKQIKNTSYI